MSQFIVTCLFATPTLICMIAVCATDLTSRIVPRLWVLLAAFAQSAANLIFSLITFNNVNFLLRGWLCAVTVFAIYVLTQKLCVRGALGFGDVTCASMIAQALALFGFECGKSALKSACDFSAGILCKMNKIKSRLYPY